jgi:hypothetical protein
MREASGDEPWGPRRTPITICRLVQLSGLVASSVCKIAYKLECNDAEVKLKMTLFQWVNFTGVFGTALALPNGE